MRKPLFLVLFYVLTPAFIFAQNAGSSLKLSSSPVVVEHHVTGSLDAASEHTIEIWFKADNVQSDQKLYSKITSDLINGYILGIENGQVKYEIFDKNGDKKAVVAGTLKAQQWTHLAASYKRGGKMRVYVNGKLEGETDAGEVDVQTNTSQLTIGANSWGNRILQFAGEIDEVRFWHGQLSEATLNKWMNKSVDTDEHFNKVQLQLYHKYNAGTGDAVTDHSNQTTNTGTISGANWQDSSVPFKGVQWFASTGPEISGVWVGHNSFTLDNILTLEGVNLSGDQSAILESNTATVAGSICSHTVPAGIEAVSCIFWYLINQDNPSVSFSFNLADYDLTNKDVVLMESANVTDFSNANIIQGTLNGSTFEIPSHTIFGDQLFYTLGFSTTPVSTRDLAEQNVAFEVSPNPSNGQFNIEIETEDVHDFELNIMDYSGKIVLKKELNAIASFYRQEFDLSNLPAGMYFLQLSTEEGMTTRKLMIE